jgi:hypothetical protein
MSKFTIKNYEGHESYLHKGAKELLYEWLTENWTEVDGPMKCDITFIDQHTGQEVYVNDGQTDFVCMEYPITDFFPLLIDENLGCSGLNYTCEYRSLTKYCPCLKCKHFKKESLRYIADIAIEHKGAIATLIEVVHKNHISNEKLVFLQNNRCYNIVEIEARHILGQIRKPKRLFCRRII